MTRPATPYDQAYKLLFSHRRMAADLVRLLGVTSFGALDLDRLAPLPTEHVGDNLRSRREDLAWLAPYRQGTGRQPGAAVVFQLEFQSSPDADMLERMAEYWVLLRRTLRRSGTVLAPGGEVPSILPVVVHTGPRRWTPARKTAPGDQDASLPRFEYRLVDVKSHLGDHAVDGNLCRAAFALDAASAQDAPAALGRLAELLAEAGDHSLADSFERWCRGVLGRRVAGRLQSLARLTEEPSMLAQTLREWEERTFQRGREEGREEGRRRGREEGRLLLCDLAARRFGAAAGEALGSLLAPMRDAALPAEIGALIVDSETAADLLEGARRLATGRDSRGQPV